GDAAPHGAGGRAPMAAGRQDGLRGPVGGHARPGVPALTPRRCDAGPLELGGGLEVLLAAVLDPAPPGEEGEVSVAARSTARGLPDHLERAVCQVMTYLAQNEYAAYYVPARFLGQVNPALAEVLLWLASHVHDEARHIEVFTKRALIGGGRAYALASTQRSLH